MAKQIKNMNDPAYDHRSPRFVMASQLLAARLEAGINQTEAAALTGFSQAYVARCESGKANMTVDTLGKFANVYGRYLRLAKEV